MVSIHLDQNDSPNRIFESLNNTGMPLSVADLIRNYLLMNITNMDDQERAYENLWYPMEELFSRSSKDFPTNFFWHYLMMDGSLPRRDETYERTQERVPASPEGSLEALNEFAKFSRFYAQIAEVDISGLDSEIANQIGRLNQWEVAVVYPFLMRELEAVSQSNGKIANSEFIALLQVIESFVIRRWVCGIPTNQLRRIFAQMPRRSEGEVFIEGVVDYLRRNNWPSDEVFRSRFVDTPIYTSRLTARTRLILWSLEESFGHKEAPEKSGDITIEHIMPQNLTEEWKRALGSDAVEIHNRWLHTVGNLTLSGYNPSLSDKAFVDKRAEFGKSNFELTKMCAAT